MELIVAVSSAVQAVALVVLAVAMCRRKPLPKVNQEYRARAVAQPDTEVITVNPGGRVVPKGGVIHITDERDVGLANDMGANYGS
jgi:hypothetical protein